MFKAAALSSRLLSRAAARHFSISPLAAQEADMALDKIQLPQIDRINTFKAANSGIPGLFSENVLSDIWFNQLDDNLANLKDAITQSTSDDYIKCFTNENSSTSSNSSNKIISQYEELLNLISIRFEKNESYLFDLSSSIYNLFYFLSSIKANTANQMIKPNAQYLLSNPPPISSNKPSNQLLISLINKSFGSVDEFLTLLNDSANSIKGNGYTWLVYKNIGGSSTNSFNKLTHLSIVNTYNHGSPLNLTADRINLGNNFEKRGNTKYQSEKFNPFKIPSLDDAESVNKLPYKFTPLLSIGSNPSFYLRDYGVYGKQTYINNVLNCIDWDIVADRIPSQN